MAIWAWLNNQLLKMQWLADLVKRLVEDGFGLSPQSPWGRSGIMPIGYLLNMSWLFH